jgi:hypothetical protein
LTAYSGPEAAGSDGFQDVRQSLPEQGKIGRAQRIRADG